MNRKPAAPKREVQERRDFAGYAIYPGKEDWKNIPGNRYRPEELEQMAKNWGVTITDPLMPFSVEV